MKLVKEKGLDDEVLVLGGGVIPESDVAAMKDAGVADIFGPGTSTAKIVDYIQENVKQRA